MSGDVLNRWYDKDPKMQYVLGCLKSLSPEDQEELAVGLMHFVNVFRKNRKEDEIPVSIGKNRTLGLYKASNKRRWYDKNPVLQSAMNTLGTMPIEDCRKISEGLLLTIESGE